MDGVALDPEETGSRVFIVDEIELPCFQVLEEPPCVPPPGGMVRRELLAPLRRLPSREALAQEVPRQGAARGFPIVGCAP